MVGEAARQLFGDFPRSVGTPLQHMVHSWGEFELFCERIVGKRNAYSSLSWYPGRALCDKVSFDLDSPMKSAAFPSEMRDDRRIDWMRADPEQAEAVLGSVCYDARKIAERAISEDIPVLAVFYGFGLHVHLLHEPTAEPKAKIDSTVSKWTEELNLETSDSATQKDQEARIMRIPNMKRVHDPSAGQGPIENTVPCDLWTVPLRRRELAEVTPGDLMDLSLYPRPSIRAESGVRPTMEFHEEYYDVNPKSEIQEESREVGMSTVDDEGLDWLLRELLQMPCMAERIQQRNPEHMVRQNSAVLLFNAGMTPEEVVDLFSRIGWVDWNRSKTEYFVNYAWRRRYSDMSCESIQRQGLCVREDDECNCRGWKGGKNDY